MKNLLVVIPAIKKSAVIPDQLVKKLNGTTLIQRAINVAKELTENKHILIVTDSEEISLIAKRNHVEYYKDPSLRVSSENIIQIIQKIVQNREEKYLFIYRANTPLIDVQTMKRAYSYFLDYPDTILTSVKKIQKKLFKGSEKELLPIGESNFYEELKAFQILHKRNSEYRYTPFIVPSEKSIEIESYQDWWICEKILQQKRIIFNVIGSLEIGMGHIYRALALAHEITDHEVIFVCNRQHEIAVEKIASMDYKVLATDNVLQTILDLKPAMVINDVLDTTEHSILSLKKAGIKVINFEDLGDGGKQADLVFNELYDTPQCEGKQYRWGHKYMALRDEFYDAVPNPFTAEVHSILITFGGTDQNNLTLLTLQTILNICRENDILIKIVCGGGYIYLSELKAYIEETQYKNIHLYHASTVMSSVMEDTQIAITSNGRTVYELADMNIPSIVMSHHKREMTHSFASLERGFINLGVYRGSMTLKDLVDKFNKLVNDSDYRKLLYLNIQKYTFRKNKQKIIQEILELL